MIDFKFEYRINDEYLFESLAFQDFICFNLYNKRYLKISCIAWQFDSKQDLNEFMFDFVEQNFNKGYFDTWRTDCKAINAYQSIESEDCIIDFLPLTATICFKLLKEALTKHYCPELVQDHIPDVKKMVDEEIVLNGVKYRRVE